MREVQEMMPRVQHNSNSTTDPGLHRWNSPIPYLFGGLAIMCGLIALALIILACSYSKSSSTNQPSRDDGDDDDQKPAKPIKQPEMEPRIAVIMAGDHNPTYLAKPAAASTPHNHERV